MIRSKYLNKQFGNWECIEVGIANVQLKKSKCPGRLNYCYYFERVCHDLDENINIKQIIKLNSSEAARVYHKNCTIEELLNRREKKETKKSLPSRSIHYKY